VANQSADFVGFDDILTCYRPRLTTGVLLGYGSEQRASTR